MELKSLMSGIDVVIDDKIKNAATEGDSEDGTGDLIVKIVERVEQEWNLPFYKAKEMPPEEIWPNLLQAASFILLDWELWPRGAPNWSGWASRKMFGSLKKQRLFRTGLHFHQREPG